MDTKTRRIVNLSFLCLLILLFLGIALLLTANNESYRNLDFFTFWLGSHLTALGQNPYDQAIWVAGHAQYSSTWIENLFYVYPLSTAIFFIPFGLLSLPVSSFFWLFLSLSSITLAGILLLSCWKNIDWRAYLIPVILGTFAFRPTFLNLFVGQVDCFIFLFISTALFLIQKQKNIWAGCFLGLTILKPNIGGPLIAMCAIYLLTQKKWKEISGLIAIPICLLLIPLFTNPGWIKDYFFVLLHKSADQNLFPNLHGLAGLITQNSPQWTTVVWLVFSAALLIFISLYIKKHIARIDPLTIIAIFVIVSLLITPYMRAYDLVLLLLPIFLITGNYAAQSEAFLKTNLVFLSWSLVSYLLLFLAVALNHDIYSVFLSLASLTVLLLQGRTEHSRGEIHSLTNSPT